MGPSILRMIAKAAAKLERCDPDYAARMVANRAAHEKRQRRKITSEFDAVYDRFVVKNEIASADWMEQDEIMTVSTVDRALLELANTATVSTDPMNGKSPERFYTHDGLTLTLTDWSKRTGINKSTLVYRLTRAGYTVSEALTLPIDGPNTNAWARKRYYVNGECLTGKQLEALSGISLRTIISRLKAGWPMNRALSIAPRSMTHENGHGDRGWCQTLHDRFGTGLAKSRDSLPKQGFSQ